LMAEVSKDRVEMFEEFENIREASKIGSGQSGPNNGVEIGSTDANKEWVGMPEFVQPDNMPVRDIIVHFRDARSVLLFSELIGQDITDKTKSLYYPNEDRQVHLGKMYIHEES
jgi:hypothetical protein